MASEEVMESLDRRLQTQDEDGEEYSDHLSPARQVVRLVRIYENGDCLRRLRWTTSDPRISLVQLYLGFRNGRSPRGRQ